MRISPKDFDGLVAQGNDLEFEWPVAKRYSILEGRIYSPTEEVTTTFPLFQHPDLFLSFARLGKDGEPSEQRILAWVGKHGLLRARGARLPEEPETWGVSSDEEIEPAPILVSDFRTEIRTAYQLLSLYAEIRARQTETVMAKFVDPPTLWTRTPPSLVDRHLQRYQSAFGEQYRSLMEEAGVNVSSQHLKHGLDLLIRCVNYQLQDVRPMLEWNWWDVPPTGSTSIGLVRWWYCPDLLSAMYVQFYLLITESTPMRICANPHCSMPFPATRKNKLFCSPGCRSTGRNYPH